MAVVIRLARHGRKKLPSYRIVVADKRMPRDGRFIERIGYYQPVSDPPAIEIEEERARHWLENGAQPTATVKKLFEKQGIVKN